MADPPLISYSANRSDINLNNPILANILLPNFNERFLSILIFVPLPRRATSP